MLCGLTICAYFSAIRVRNRCYDLVVQFVGQAQLTEQSDEAHRVFPTAITDAASIRRFPDGAVLQIEVHRRPIAARPKNLGIRGQ